MKKFAKVFSVFALSLLLGAASLTASNTGVFSSSLPGDAGYDITITDVTGLGMELQATSNLNSGDNFFANIYSVASGDAILTFSHENGEMISQQNLSLEEGSNRIKCNLGHFAAGMYILKVSSASGTSQKAILIK